MIFKLRDLPPFNSTRCQKKIKEIFNEQCSLVQSGQKDIETVLIKEESVISEQFCDENIPTIIKEEPPSP